MEYDLKTEMKPYDVLKIMETRTYKSKVVDKISFEIATNLCCIKFKKAK